MQNLEQIPFAELPEALVEEMLSKSEFVGEKLKKRYRRNFFQYAWL